MSTYHPQPPPPEEHSGSATPWGTIIGIVAVVIVVFVGLPLLVCAGVLGFGYMKAREVATQIQAQQQAAPSRLEDLAATAGLADALYPKAKEAIAAHWTEPVGIRSRRWSDWQVQKLDGNRYEIHGRLETLSRQSGRKTHQWSCEFTPIGAAGPNAEWQLEKVVVDGQQCHP